jgi:hypothetical protein
MADMCCVFNSQSKFKKSKDSEELIIRKLGIKAQVSSVVLQEIKNAST